MKIVARSIRSVNAEMLCRRARAKFIRRNTIATFMFSTFRIRWGIYRHHHTNCIRLFRRPPFLAHHIRRSICTFQTMCSQGNPLAILARAYRQQPPAFCRNGRSLYRMATTVHDGTIAAQSRHGYRFRFAMPAIPSPRQDARFARQSATNAREYAQSTWLRATPTSTRATTAPWSDVRMSGRANCHGLAARLGARRPRPY